MDKLNEYSDEFNSAIKFLARIYAFKKKGTFEEEKAVRNNKRLSIVIASEPIWMIENCGPFFLKYADDIKNKNWDEFLKKDFNEEKQRYKDSDDGSKHSYDAMDSKIEFIKKIFLSSDDKERVAMGDAVQTLLSAYCKYVICIKNRS